MALGRGDGGHCLALPPRAPLASTILEDLDPQVVCSLNWSPGGMRKVIPCELQALGRPRTIPISRENLSQEKEDHQEPSFSAKERALKSRPMSCGHCRVRPSRRTLKTVLRGSSGVASRTAAPSCAA